ncbi:hypothetical protein [Mycobacterium intracellulare]|uniref:hypothetical protein n=1 Tax=Mycobacterium intracellulare TaxID=1767 RepID=UPI0019168ADE|nr:hypothetical protein [Mycobacterium intracellulare]MCA2355765.1 hypothetical protein [Mycobacterium intracellulare]MCA2365987.1 hypothetical protein [Mycobacterium intracellulare]
MKIAPQNPDAYWVHIAANASTRGHTAPWQFQMQLAVLVGEHQVVGSAVNFSSDGAGTTWSAVAVTDDGRLVKVVIVFNAESYDLEQERSYRETDPVYAVHEAWVRPLSEVVGLEVGKVGPRLNAFSQARQGEFNIGDVRLRFAHDQIVQLGFDQLAMPYNEDRRSTDELFAVIRAETGL